MSGLLNNIIFYAAAHALEQEQQRMETPKSQKKRPRLVTAGGEAKRPYSRDYSTCNWWSDFIYNLEVLDPSSTAAKCFRRRFRVPFPVYEEILTFASEAEPIGSGKTITIIHKPYFRSWHCLDYKMYPISCAGIPGIPLPLQILSVLRVLGRGTCFDGIEEITGGSAEAHRVFFHDFCRRFSKRFYSTYVHIPETEEELKKAMSDYSRMGLPGAFASMDCVHARWGMCPTSLRNLCVGKEGYPTLAWQCHVNHK